MIPILVAHGTRTPHGVVMIGELAERVGALLAQPVRVAFIDVLGPSPAEILAAEAQSGRPAVLIPAFLARGYHVGVDVPVQVAASGHPDVTITPALGPDPRVAEVVADRLTESGWRPSDAVVLAAAGSSDPLAQSDVEQAAQMLSGLIGSPVTAAFAATGGPSVGDAVTTLRNQGAGRVVVASYLLADGFFQRRLRNSGADLVTEPLGAHAGIARVIADRVITACTRIPVR
ncbi:cobalamin biosynthesis protein CbiX [Mycolicibacter nonchromogenicus]|uniref:Cobalamin biosynthesis protein CbiX n=1 Tax=Mycolicibacter nonchromogenicus TaxID=1782 RepID=A0A1X1Z8P5_MYCNO|nr:sirohydrochlorin chelatase [Mycolicibacter nonchromogenicus]OBI07546.1 cobalamin biosynthesis protein CbiX [Mycolicibacter heraklionensis]ORW19783.1 cobalamin biosynthesis protein CbiX [Mycolicibacter nonchromogenicus]